jgi:chloramphenicol-sensitive protein RarD
MNHVISDEQKGYLFGALSYLLWGLLPLFWWLLRDVSPTEVLCHRIIWSGVLLCIFLIPSGAIKKVLTHSKKELSLYFLSGIFLTINWLTYIWAVSSGYVLASSLGYFLAPLVYIVFACVFLKERLTKYQKVSIVFCLLAVIFLLHSADLNSALVAFLLSLSIVIYGFIRKKVVLRTDHGLFLESVILMPFALIFLIYGTENYFSKSSFDIKFLLFLSGPATLIPLLFYCSALSKISLISIGYLQYISPIFQFLLGILFFKETISLEKGAAFLLVWIGIFIITIEKVSKKFKKAQKFKN